MSVVDVVAQDISYWHLIAEASLVVKLVMLILVGAIWAALVIIFNRMQVLGKAKRAFFRFEDKLPLVFLVLHQRKYHFYHHC